MVQCFSELQYKDSVNEHHVIESMRNMLHSDKDVPVRLEAAIALQMLLKHQHAGTIAQLSPTSFYHSTSAKLLCCASVIMADRILCMSESSAQT